MQMTPHESQIQNHIKFAIIRIVRARPTTYGGSMWIKEKVCKSVEIRIMMPGWRPFPVGMDPNAVEVRWVRAIDINESDFDSLGKINILEATKNVQYEIPHSILKEICKRQVEEELNDLRSQLENVLWMGVEESSLLQILNEVIVKEIMST